GGASWTACASACCCSSPPSWWGRRGGDRARGENREPARAACTPGGGTRQGGEPVPVRGRAAQGRADRERREQHGRDDAGSQVRRLRAAVRDVKRHSEEVKARAAERAGPDEARIFDAQLLMLEDKEFLAGAEDLIRENHLTAEKAFEFKALEVRDLWTATGST